MKALKVAAFLAFATCTTFQQAQSAGLKFMEIPSDNHGPTLTGAVWYPCNGKPEKVDIGFDYSLAVKDCPVSGKNRPLIVISHGVGGWIGNYHGLAEMLADNGFVVAAINHPRDSGQSKTRDPGDIAAMTQRPTDMKRLIDYLVGPGSYANQIDASRIGVFGFSRGGNTGLAMIGGKPDWKLLLNNCPIYPGNRFCEQIKAGSVVEMESDARIKAAVIVDPAGGSLFTAEGLKGISVPVQLWGSERGVDGVSPEDTANIIRNMSTKPDFQSVPKSNHFSFLPPCTSDFAKLAAESGDTELCSDDPGFDRVAFHKQFNADILAFFSKHLSE
ncbi:alpha/beta hydrolase [Phyllobacterium sp. YR531]|uniref:alpha/beta hydrolase family protein n=1 Tax=Phyllobacterium sp. YR531 TaxID=1144343 RepID=UPI00026F648D|nr:alpha/beta hydrolase [Phyllobacterium sp. YR531]EJM98797.1 putative dienelactone hydrolase [Phyllobacterium sp. YR531]